MPKSKSTSNPIVRDHRAEVDEQLWPTVCATLVLVGVLGVVVWKNSDFDEDRLLFNGYTHLVALGAAAGLLIFLASRLRGAARRTAELAIVLSLALHAAGGLGAFYIFSGPLVALSFPDAVRDAQQEADDEPPPPDYHWGQEDEQEPQQAFEQSVATTLRDQGRPAAQLQPHDVDRSKSVAAITRVPKVEITPLGAAEVPDSDRPLIRRSDAAKIEDPKIPEAVAMVRQKADELPLPKFETPVPLTMPEAPKEPPKTPESAVQAEKVDWATTARSAATKGATANNEPVSPRVEPQPSDDLLAANIGARLPSQPPPQTPSDQSGPKAADQITQPGSSLERSDGGVPLPSTVIPSPGLPAQSPAAPGSSSPSRLEPVSTIPVEKSDTLRAPLGPAISSRGRQDFAAGSTLSPSRQGMIDGHGRAQPSMPSDVAEDTAEFRSGAPGSNLSNGLSLSLAPARRAIPSQTEDADTGASASQPGSLPRTQSKLGLEFPAFSKIAESPMAAGAGGAARRPGGQTSNLVVGQQITIRRSAGAGTADDNFHGAGAAALGVGDILPGNDMTAPGGAATAVRSGPSGPRRIEQGAPEGDDTPVSGISRGNSEIIIPHPAANPIASVTGSANATGEPAAGGASPGFATNVVGPNAGLGGIERRDTYGQGTGVHPSGQFEPSEIAANMDVTSALPAGRGHRGDGSLDQILAGDGSGLGGISRGNSQIVVSGLVHEPMEAFRRGPVHGGLAIGDSVAGQLTEPAIENGLEYFSHTQFSDGHWSLHELPEGAAADPGSLGGLHADTAATGLALLSYLGAGYTHQDEKYRDLIRRGVGWLVKHQQPDGSLSYHDSPVTQFYSHGIAAMALCEAYGMTQDRELRGPAQKAIDFIVKSQDPRRGGWRYRPREDSDTSITGWQLMALKSAQMAGLEVPEQTLSKVGHWLDLAQVPNRGTYVYNPWNLDTELERAGRAPSPTMTAQAMIMRMYLGQDRGNASMAQGADYLLAHMPDAAAQETSYRDCYYWYYATQAMYHMQGEYWKAWDARVTPLVRAEQVDRGPLKGSWSPRDPALDRWSREGGRHYVTAMHVLTLEFRYWHLPLFRELRKD